MVALPPGGILQTPGRDRKNSLASLGAGSNTPGIAPENLPLSPSSPTFGNQKKAGRMGKLIKVVAENSDEKVLNLYQLRYPFLFLIL